MGFFQRINFEHLSFDHGNCNRVIYTYNRSVNMMKLEIKKQKVDQEERKNRFS